MAVDLSKARLSHRPFAKIIGKDVYCFEEISSTNDACFDLANLSFASGTSVVSDIQTKGRGRAGKMWQSASRDSLYVSTLLKPAFNKKHYPLMNFVVALAIIRAIRSFHNVNCYMKWPNDIVISSKKVAGILIETKGPYLIVGAGININNFQETFPDDIRDSAISILTATGVTTSKECFLYKYMEMLERYFEMLEHERSDEILNEARSFSFTLGKFVKINNNGQEIEGRATDIEDDGMLILETPDGKIVKITSGELINGS